MKNIRFIAICAALLVGAPVPGLTASSDLAITNFPADAYAFLSYTYIGAADLKEADTGRKDSTGRIHELETLAAVPVWQRDAHCLLLGANLKYNRFEFENVDLAHENVYAMRLPVDFIHDAGGDWMFWANITPGLASDMEYLNRDDYKTQLHGMAVYRMHPRLHLAAGAAYDSAFGDDDLYPMGGLIWRAGEQWLVNMLLPMPTLFWRPHQKLMFFAEARPAGDKWNIRVEDEPDDFDFKLECWRLGGGLEYNLAGGIWLHLGAGAVLERKYEVSAPGNDLYKSDADDAWFTRIAILAR